MIKNTQKFRVLSSKKQRKIERNIRLLFPGQVYDAMTDRFLKDSERSMEGYAIAECGLKADPEKKNWTYMVKEVHIPERGQLLEQSSVSVTPKAEFMEEILSRAADRNSSVIELHTHVDSPSPNFSWKDIDHGLDNGRFLKSCRIKFLMAVMGAEGFSLSEYDGDHDSLQVPEKAVISIMTRSGIKDMMTHKSNSSTEQISPVFDRQLLIWGEGVQAQIQSMKIGIAGLGGTGSILLQMLARMGVKKFVLCDHDIVEESNLSRLPYSFSPDIGKKKVKIASNYLKKISKDIEVTAFPEKVQQSKEEFKDCDVIFGCVDTEAARLTLNEISLKYFIPYIDTGTEIFMDDKKMCDIGGQVRVVIPSVTGCLECMGGIDKEMAALESLDDESLRIRDSAGYVRGTDITPTPSVITLNTIIASMAAQEFLNIAQGIEEPASAFNYLKYNAKSSDIERLVFEKSESCPLCGSGGILGSGDIKKQVKQKIKTINTKA